MCRMRILGSGLAQFSKVGRLTTGLGWTWFPSPEATRLVGVEEELDISSECPFFHRLPVWAR
ncbi:unnamed protein product [Clavelina lepadiformis]|uniref:Uncharacterized protein n=1 Tax=Clavelina lepadiformis TaxID=159417 RepID=A0ABP0GX14_CLALP